MNNTILRKLVLTADYQPLVSSRMVASVTLSTPPTNSGDAIFRGDDGGEVPWVPGEWHTFQRINLAEILIKGTPGDVVTVVGGTW